MDWVRILPWSPQVWTWSEKIKVLPWASTFTPLPTDARFTAIYGLAAPLPFKSTSQICKDGTHWYWLKEVIACKEAFVHWRASNRKGSFAIFKIKKAKRVVHHAVMTTHDAGHATPEETLLVGSLGPVGIILDSNTHIHTSSFFSLCADSSLKVFAVGCTGRRWGQLRTAKNWAPLAWEWNIIFFQPVTLSLGFFFPLSPSCSIFGHLPFLDHN